MSAVGALLGAGAASGVLLFVVGLPFFHRPSLADRVGPYLPEFGFPPYVRAKVGGGLLGLQPRRLLHELSGRVDRLVGRRTSIRHQLDALGAPMTVDEFRQEQVLYAITAGGGGLLLLGLRLGIGAGPPPLSFVGLVFVATFGGFIGREMLLVRAVRMREERLELELPAVAELLALAVGSGESPIAALERVSRRSGGELGRELSRAVADSRSGTSFVQAIGAIAERTSLPALRRFVDGISISLQRGTPLAEVLRAQALDVREDGRRKMLETGGKKEIAMMVPVVFLVLPVTILFALYPGAVTLTTMSQ